MSKEMIKIKEVVMEKIRNDEVKMRPRIFFVVGSILTFLGLVASIITSVFFVSLIRFSLRTHGPMGQYRLDQLLASFPWWALVVAVVGLIAGIFFLRQYTFSYRHNIWLVVSAFVFAVIFAGVIINAAGLDNAWLNRGPMRGMMRESMQGRYLNNF